MTDLALGLGLAWRGHWVHGSGLSAHAMGGGAEHYLLIALPVI